MGRGYGRSQRKREGNKGYKNRVAVTPSTQSWDTTADDYDPKDFTSDNVLVHGAKQGWADNADPATIDFSDRHSFLEYKIGSDGRPLNPMGRQGIKGRGNLGKWGPNHAADPVVIAVDEDGNKKILLIKRGDTDEWALPGGMVDPGESVTLTAQRELMEETGINLKRITPEIITEEYVNDPRNTDNAWMETTASLFVINSEIKATAGDDAADAKWFNLSSIDQLRKDTNGLYASHDNIIIQALNKL